MYTLKHVSTNPEAYSLRIYEKIRIKTFLNNQRFLQLHVYPILR